MWGRTKATSEFPHDQADTGDVSVHGLERYGSISTGGHRKPELDEGQKSINNQKEDPNSISLGDTQKQKQKGKAELHAQREKEKRESTTVWWKLSDDIITTSLAEKNHGDPEEVLETMPLFIFHPNSIFRTIWDLIVLVFLVYFVIAVPYRMCFIDTQFEKTPEDCGSVRRPTVYSISDEEYCFPIKGCTAVTDLEEQMCSYVVQDKDWPYIILSTAIDCFFLIDILINFRTAFYQSAAVNGSGADRDVMKLVTGSSPIFRRYFSSWFLIDLLGSLPLDLVTLFLASSESDKSDDISKYALLTKMVRFLKIFRLLKLVRAARIGRLIQKLQDTLAIRPSTVQLFSLLFQFFTIAHVMACLLFLVGITNEDFDCKSSPASFAICSDEDVLSGRKVSWLTESSIVSREFGETSIYHAPTDTQYMMAFYWAVTTMTTVGYGDIKPFTHLEVVACIIFMIVGAYAFSYVVGTLGTLVGELGGDEAEFRAKMEAVTVFMHDHNVPKDLKLKIRKYYDYSFSNPYVEVSSSDLGDLSPSLQRELSKFFCKNILSTSMLFHAASGENEQRVLLQLLQHLTHKQHGPGDYIFYEGEIGREVFFIFSGELDIVDADAREVVATFRKGSFVGENALLEGEEMRTFSLKSRGWSDVLELSVADLDGYMRDFPQLTASIRLTAKVRWGRLDAAINTHKVLRRARTRAAVTGKKLLRVMARFAEEELSVGNNFSSSSPIGPASASTSSPFTPISPKSPATKGLGGVDPVTGEKFKKKNVEAMTREEVEILGDLRSSVLHREVGQDLAARVFRRGLEKWDWSWDWVDSPDIVDEVSTLQSEYDGILVAERAVMQAPDVLDRVRAMRGATQDDDTNLNGQQLERVLQKIVFRLDLIDEQLESHHLLTSMRQLRAAALASGQHTATQAQQNLTPLRNLNRKLYKTPTRLHMGGPSNQNDDTHTHTQINAQTPAAHALPAAAMSLAFFNKGNEDSSSEVFPINAPSHSPVLAKEHVD